MTIEGKRIKRRLFHCKRGGVCRLVAFHFCTHPGFLFPEKHRLLPQCARDKYTFDRFTTATRNAILRHYPASLPCYQEHQRWQERNWGHNVQNPGKQAASTAPLAQSNISGEPSTTATELLHDRLIAPTRQQGALMACGQKVGKNVVDPVTGL